MTLFVLSHLVLQITVQMPGLFNISSLRSNLAVLVLRVLRLRCCLVFALGLNQLNLKDDRGTGNMDGESLDDSLDDSSIYELW